MELKITQPDDKQPRPAGCGQQRCCGGACGRLKAKAPVGLDGQDDRRREPREPSEAPIKVFDRRSQRFYPGRAVNISPRGALIQIKCPRPIGLGQALDVFVAGEGETIVPAAAFRSAVVVRIDGDRIALRVEPEHALRRPAAA